MTSWWDRARAPGTPATLLDGRPVLVPGGRAALIAELRARVAGFTPEWRPGSEGDAGEALIRLFGAQLDPVASRAEQIEARMRTLLLSAAGLELAAPRPASAHVTFEIAPAAPAPAVIAAGFQLSSASADGSPDDIIWETATTLLAHSCSVAETLSDDGETARPVSGPFAPFGTGQPAGASLLIGIAAPRGLHGEFSLGVLLDGAAPDPVSIGGAPRAISGGAQLRWEALAGGRFQPVEMIADDSGGLALSGAVRFRIPAGFAADRPARAGEGLPRHWLRLRLIGGRLPGSLRISSLIPNLVRVDAVRTIRDELPVAIGSDAPGQWQLARTPVLPGSLILDVDESIDGNGIVVWSEVASLVGQSPDARVFTLDPVAGIIRFGNNVEGRRPPLGIRSIVARRYAIASGRGGAVEAGAISRALKAVPHLKSVTNPEPATGGVDAGTLPGVLAAGPAELAARGRGVSPAGMAMLATAAPGADIARAFAVRGSDATAPGASLAGVTTLYVLPRRRPGDARAGPPVAGADTLAAVAGHVARHIGPLGARIVAANPRFQAAAIEATVEIDPEADAGIVTRQILDALDRYLDPYAGGGEGWQLGATLRHARINRQIFDAAAAVRSISWLSILVDGRPNPPCGDVTLAANALPWPAAHLVLTTKGGLA